MGLNKSFKSANNINHADIFIYDVTIVFNRIVFYAAKIVIKTKLFCLQQKNTFVNTQFNILSKSYTSHLTF